MLAAGSSVEEARELDSHAVVPRLQRAGTGAAPERRPDMTAPPRTLPDFGTLDRYIADALVVLRLARAASTRSRNSETIRAEEDAESRLNGLLECRFATQRR